MLLQHAHDAVQAIYELLWHTLQALFAPLSLIFANAIRDVYPGSASLTLGGTTWLGDSLHTAKMVKIGLAHVLALGSIFVTSELARAQTCPDYTSFSMVNTCFFSPSIMILHIKLTCPFPLNPTSRRKAMHQRDLLAYHL